METSCTHSAQDPPSLPALFKRSRQAQHTPLAAGLSLHGTGWEWVLGVKELQGQVLMAAAPFSPPSLLRGLCESRGVVWGGGFVPGEEHLLSFWLW